MTLSVFDIFKIGIGPSSSHTMGPMRAAREFALELKRTGVLGATQEIAVRLYGSLALTGLGHGTDRAILAGLEGAEPQSVEPDGLEATVQRGGFIVRGDETEAREAERAAPPYPFTTAAQLLESCRGQGLELFELMMANEVTWRSPAEVRAELLHIWSVMQGCVERGFRQTGILPGVLRVRRRAPKLYRMLIENRAGGGPLDVMDWVNAWALAVNEENAAGGRIVTAPTNGAAGIVPAVLHYYQRFESGASEDGILRFLLTAGAIGMLYKRNASISGAEMGCQGEVGVACSMAAGGLVAALHGSNEQAENAAEIGMEHNLGLTCDPVAGLVQIPCIERNAMGAVKAINAARLAIRGDGTHKVSLDQVIATMRQTGHDMATIYKETSEGGLAVNVPDC